MDFKKLFQLLFLLTVFSCSETKKEKTEDNSLELTSFVRLLEYDLDNLEREIIALGDTIQYLF